MKSSRHSSRSSSAAAAAAAAASSTPANETGVVSISRRGSTISSTVAQTPAPTISTLPIPPSTTTTSTITNTSTTTTTTTTPTTVTPTTSTTTTNTPITKATSSTNSKVQNQKATLKDEWSVKEKLYLASLAIKHNNAWNSVARNMQSVFEKDRPEGWSNTKSCAAQFDKLMNELGVDKRPKRNEPSDGNSSSVIYRKMAEKRIKELEDSIKNLRKLFIDKKNQLDSLEKQQPSESVTASPATSTTNASKDLTIDKSATITGKSTSKAKQNSNITSTIHDIPDKTKQPKQQVHAKHGPDSHETQTTTTSAKSASTSTKFIATRNSSIPTTPKTESEKPPTRALTRRESSRKNLDTTLENLCKEASEIKTINLFGPPTKEDELALYEKVIRKPMDLSIIKQRLGSNNTDSYAVINDLLLMFQNAIMFYPPDHDIYRKAVELRDILLPKWEKSLLETKSRKGL